MARHVLRLIAVFVILTSAGCVRIPFDLCDEADAHPDCMTLDGGADVTDASPEDAMISPADSG